MPESVLDMSMSLDGYISDPNDFLGGEDGERLHDWFAFNLCSCPGRPKSVKTNGMRPALSSRAGGGPAGAGGRSAG